MFSTRSYFTHATTKAKATIAGKTHAGVVANLDSASNPQNFVSAYHETVDYGVPCEMRCRLYTTLIGEHGIGLQRAHTWRLSVCLARTYTNSGTTVRR